MKWMNCYKNSKKCLLLYLPRRPVMVALNEGTSNRRFVILSITV
jgi:hypothetical protein